MQTTILTLADYSRASEAVRELSIESICHKTENWSEVKPGQLHAAQTIVTTGG